MVVDEEKEKRRKRAVAKHRLREKEDKNLIKIVKWWVNILLEHTGRCWGGGMVESVGSNAEMSRREIHLLKYTEKNWRGVLEIWREETEASYMYDAVWLELTAWTGSKASRHLWHQKCCVCVSSRGLFVNSGIQPVYKTAESPQSVGAFSFICLHVFLNWDQVTVSSVVYCLDIFGVVVMLWNEFGAFVIVLCQVTITF